MSIWGKIIGGTAGFAIGGPFGAILGVMAGSIYDKSKKLIGGKIGHIMVDEKSSISVQTKVGWDYCTNYFGLSKSNGS